MPHITSIVQPTLETDIVPSSDLPLYEEVLNWVTTILRPAGVSKPLCKRLAVIIAGLLASEKATIGEVATAIEGLNVSQAKGESIARRLQRALQDARLSPSLLTDMFRPLLPELLRDFLSAHAANVGTPAFHHARFTGVTIIFDESSQEEWVHVAVAGIPVGGVVLPLTIRTWQQNSPLPEGTYWNQIMGMLQEVQEMLPPVLRDHVLLTGDRLYGVPRMIDILTALGWNWLLRVQGHTQILRQDGTQCQIRTLVPQPGTQWSSGFSNGKSSEAIVSEPIGVFKSAGWRRSQVVAVWAIGQPEPWLMVTSLPGRLREWQSMPNDGRSNDCS